MEVIGVKDREPLSEVVVFITLMISQLGCCSMISLNYDHKRSFRVFLDRLYQVLQLAVHEQKDPLLIYKFEGFEMFKRFIGRVNEDTISFLMKAL